MRRSLSTLVLLTACGVAASTANAQRATGIDVSDWQGGSINWATVAKPTSQGGGGIQFAFIRATRGGTIGTYNESTKVGTGSQRYDDLYLTRNVTNAKANGILTGVYHFARIDLINNTDANFPGYTGNTGLDEANHFLEISAQYMTPGNLRPVLDIEAGATQTNATTLTNWCLQFSDRIFAVTGVRPIVYINTSYATSEVTSAINSHDMWLARYTYTAADGVTAADRTNFAADAQTVDPPTPSGYTNPYGVFKTAANPVPWDFWQYTSDGRTPGISGAVDQDVANGDINYVREFLVPAVWMASANGDWSAGSNWNARGALPTANDRTIIDRPGGDYLVTLSTGSRAVRSLQLNDRLAISGGSLAVTQYVNVANALTVSGGGLSADSIANTSTISQIAGTLTANTITGTGTLAVGGGTLKAKSIRQNTLTITGGLTKLENTTAASVVKAASFSGAGVLDLADGALIVDYTGSVSPLSTLRIALRSGWNNGTWDGPGIASSTLAPGEGIAMVEASKLFTDFTTANLRGERVDNTAVLFLPALSGDANLDGHVEFADLLIVAKTYNFGGTWISGDMTYDGVVDFEDLLALAKNYNQTSPSPLSAPASADGTFAADWALAQSLVPEPASLSLLAFGTLTRRRRR